jgi:multiple sugar transport system substrate-binding protein
MRNFFLTVTMASMVLIGAGCLGGGAPQMRSVTLEYWRMTDQASDLDSIIAAYREAHPQVAVNVTVIPAERYQKELLTALAEDRGPDLFSLPNVWLKSWQNKLQPIPAERAIIEQDQDQAGQTVTVLRKKSALSLLQLDRDYVELVADDVVMNVPAQPGQPTERGIYGLPYSSDTLALYYNRDLLANANFGSPAETWSQLADQSQILSRQNDDGELVQSGVAMGGSNVRHGAEVLAALMLQNGAEMANENQALFARIPPGYDQPLAPGLVALQFYRSFGDPNSSNWSWDRNFSDSLEQFVSGKTAYYFGFPEDAGQISRLAPRLDLGITSLPQVNPTAKKNVALYPVEVVSAKSRNADYAWDFLVFANQAEHVAEFLELTSRPTALRSLINEQLDNERIYPFVSQVLTAESWYSGYDYPAAQAILLDLADQVAYIEGDDKVQINDAANAVTATFAPPRR